jgi:GNAT superfamily N-acetyltransferase
MGFSIRRFSGNDMDETDVILRAAYRTQFGRKDNLRRYLEVEPSYPIVARENSKIIGFGAALDYGPFSYIGLMAVDPQIQKRGAGAVILEDIMRWLSRRNCPTILLDASAAGVRLYENHGFIHEDITYVVQLKEAVETAEPPTDSISILNEERDFENLCTFDEPFFGANRRLLLSSYFRTYSQRCFISRDAQGRVDGYLIAQDRVIGPWVVSSKKIAENLLSRALKLEYVDPPTVFASGSNKNCLDLLRKYGFEVQRSLEHMYKGKRIQRSRATNIYGMTTLGFG